jgi:phosphoribosylaminoimidazole-succinocarboxamide synthase
MLVRSCEIVKIEVVRPQPHRREPGQALGRREGEHLPEPIIEHYYKDDALGDPLINDWHIRYLRLATAQEVAQSTRSRSGECAHARVPRQARDRAGRLKLEFGPPPRQAAGSRRDLPRHLPLLGQGHR